jgi:folylpolyglutamate synthase/dihydropteroate synthase
VIVTSAQNARAINFEAIADMVREQGHAVECAANVREAIAHSMQGVAPVIVTGSIYLIAEAREAWMERHGAPITERDV